MNLNDFDNKTTPLLSKNDKEILKDLKNLIKDVTKDMDNFNFHIASEKLYQYFWHVFADKIIEQNKERLQNKKERATAQYLLITVLETSLKTLHPFMPYITEEIYQMIPTKNKKKFLMIEDWPQKI